MSDPFRLNGPQIPQSGLMGEIQSEVATEATPLLSFVVRHIKLLVGAVILLIVAIVGVGIWHWHEGNVNKEAQMALGKVRLSTSGADRIAALEKLSSQLPASMRQGLLLELAVTALEINDLDRAAKAYGDLAAMDARSPFGFMSAYNQASILQRAGKYAEALSVLDVLYPNAPEGMKPLVLESQAVCAELAGKFDRALTAYENMASGLKQGDGAPFIQHKIKELKAKKATS